MAQIIDIRHVEVGPKSFTARVRVAIGAPLMTSDDLEGTTRVYRLLPRIIEHTCLGDASDTFKDVMGDTEIAHLLEHVTVELLAQTDIAGDITCGRTWAVADERRTYDVEFPCPDDVLVAGALSSAVWILQWAYTGGGDPEPDVEATVRGLVELVQSLPEPAPAPDPVREYVVYGEAAAALVREMAGEMEADEVPAESAEAHEEDAPSIDSSAATAAAPRSESEQLEEGLYAVVADAEEAAQAAEALPWDDPDEVDSAFDAGLADDAFDTWEDAPAPRFMR